LGAEDLPPKKLIKIILNAAAKAPGTGDGAEGAARGSSYIDEIDKIAKKE